MESFSNSYILSSSHQHHKDTLRTVACNSYGLILTGSFDKTCSFFQSTSDGKYEFIKDTKYHDDYIYITRPDILSRGFFSGSKDKRIIYMDNEGNPVGEFMGHNGTINSISQSKDDNNLFISGSWDTTARIWDLNKQENISILEGHSYAVTVLALPNKKYVTGSQDKNLYFWDGDRKVNTVQNAHDDIIRSIILSPDSQSMFTTSNDMKIKQWSLNGQLLNTFNAHDGFIFNLCFNLKSHQLFSCGDDRVVKVWKENGNYEQSLLHPNTIWDAAYNPINDDILTACADSVLRVFSNNNKRWMNENALKEYNNLCNLAAAQSEGEGNNQSEQVDINTLPSITEMSNLKNIKDGEIRLFNNFGKAEAYCYKLSEDKWELLGEVMGQKSAPQKKYYPGDDIFKEGNYDYIFDVELNDGITQLPFNEGDNILVAAEKFVGREKLHKAYVDDIMKFLRANTGKNKGKKPTITQKKDYSKPKPKPQNISNNKPQSTKNYSFPIMRYSFYESINCDGPNKKINEFNSKINEGDKNKKLTDFQLKQIGKVLKVIGEKAFYHNSNCDEYDLKEFLNLFTSWHDDLLVPIFDVFRMFLLHPQSNMVFKKAGGGVEQLTILLLYLKNNNIQILSILAMRCICNMFNNEYSRNLLQVKRQDILDLCGNYVDNDNKHIRGGIINILFNYSIIFSTLDDSEASLQICALINEILQKETNVDNIILMLQSLGNLFVLSENNRIIGKDMDIAESINSVSVDNDNGNVQELKDFINTLLK